MKFGERIFFVRRKNAPQAARRRTTGTSSVERGRVSHTKRIDFGEIILTLCVKTPFREVIFDEMREKSLGKLRDSTFGTASCFKRHFSKQFAKSVREIWRAYFFVRRKNALILARLFSMLRKANEAIGVRQCYLHGEHRLPMFNTAERGKNPPKVIFCTPYSLYLPLSP